MKEGRDDKEGGEDEGGRRGVWERTWRMGKNIGYEGVATDVPRTYHIC